MISIRFTIAVWLLALLSCVAATAQQRLVVPVSQSATITSSEDTLVSRTLLKFSLPQELSNVTIDYAVLRFKPQVSFIGNDTVHSGVAVYPISSAWSGNVSWSSGWTNPGGDYIHDRATLCPAKSKTGAQASVLVNRIVQDWVDGRLANNGLILMSTDEERVSLTLSTNAGLPSSDIAELTVYFTKRE